MRRFLLAAVGLLLMGQSSPSTETVPPLCTVAQLAAGNCAPAKLGTRVRISNSDSTGDTNCAVGTGSNTVLCEYDGTVWRASGTPPTSINLTGSSNPCALIQSAVDDFLTGNQDVAIEVTGRGTVDFADLTARASDTYRTCVYVANPASFKSANTGSLSIEWRNAELDFIDNTQTKPVVLMQLSDRYGNFGGNNGLVSRTLSMSGRLTLESSVSVDAGWTTGDQPGLPFGTNIPSTGLVALFISGLTNTDLSNLDLQLYGGPAIDDNDVGVMLENSFGLTLGGLEINEFGTAMMVKGANDGSSVQRVYFQGNRVGLVIGDRYNPDRLALDGGAFANEQPRGVDFMSGVIEGNTYGNLIFYNGDRFRFNLHIENGTQNNHGVIMGAGVCTVSVEEACGLAAQCGSGVCNAPTTAVIANTRIGNVWFSGFSDGGDGTFRGFVLGPGAVEEAGHSYHLFFEDMILAEDAGQHLYSHGNATIYVKASQATKRLPPRPWGYDRVMEATGGQIAIATGQNWSATPWQIFDPRIITNDGATGNITHTLPVPAASMAPITFCDVDNSGTLSLEPDAGGAPTIIIMENEIGTLAAGDKLVSVGDGSCVTLQGVNATTWVVKSRQGNWADGGP